MTSRATMDREILRLAIPNILSNLSVPLIGLADTALMGRMENPSYLGAIALGGILFNFIYWGFGFLRMSTVGLTAQAFGKAFSGKASSNASIGLSSESLSRIFSQALTVALTGAAIILLLQIPIASLGFELIKGEESVKALAREYFFVRIWAAPATLSLYAINGWLLGMQNARYPLLLTVVTNVANVFFNIWFVVGMDMDVRGVALGTICAQYLGLILAAVLLWSTYKEVISGFFKNLSLNGLGQYFAVSRDIFIRTICLLTTFSLFTSESAGKGEIVLAANSILLQLFYVMSYGVDGFAFAAESLTGKFIGAADRKTLVAYLRRIFGWGMALGVLFGLIFLIGGDYMIALLTDLMQVQQMASDYLWWIVAVSVAGAAAFLWDGVYIGATASVAMRNSMLVATLLIFIPVLYLTEPWLGANAMWAAMVLFMLFRSVSLGVMLPKQVLSKAAEKD